MAYEKRLQTYTNNLYCRKLQSLIYIFAADRMGLCLSLHSITQIPLKVKPSESKTAGRKTEFDIKWPLGHHSSSGSCS